MYACVRSKLRRVLGQQFVEHTNKNINCEKTEKKRQNNGKTKKKIKQKKNCCFQLLLLSLAMGNFGHRSRTNEAAAPAGEHGK